MFKLRILSLHRKLLLLLAIPLVGLLVFASEAIVSRKDVVNQMEHLRSLVDVGVSVSSLIHEVQRERGLSSGYVASGGDRLGDELQAQRAATDQKLAVVREGLKQLESDNEQLRLATGRVEPLLSQIVSHRETISNLSATPEQTLAFYNQLNKQLIQLITQIAKSTSHTDLAQQLIVLNYLVEIKELRGIERALVNGLLSADADIDGVKQALTRNLHGQDAIHELLLAYANTEQADLVRNALSGQDADTVRRIRERVVASPTSAPAPPRPRAWPQAEGEGSESESESEDFLVPEAPAAPAPESLASAELAESWWSATTSVIDRLAQVEREYADWTAAAAEELREDARSSALLYLLATIGVSLVAGGLSWLISRSISRPLVAGADSARDVAEQIVQATSQQKENMQNTATAVAETTTTVDEIRQTSEAASLQSDRVAKDAESNIAAATQAQEAVEHGLKAMQMIRQEVEGIARNILDLSEKNLQIGEIVQTVNGLAEQSNLLAVNASIEAAKAGEHGRGFSVVASEVKILAGRSKDATEQIRTILSDIQKSSNAAVMVTEQGVKRVEEGQALIEELGQTIRALGGVIESNVDSAQQISMTSKQQLAGVEQINQAMQSLGESTKDLAASAAQLTAAAEQVRGVSDQLGSLVAGSA
ncbi:MAG: nitrate- and nitrite sensing domain-containing protein [Enhygromyxa sp.]